ncbi:hypothetical protein TMES_10490 [Thalassospira mesophila]|uniref:Uncharacterized protein n=1 Tax=Thalassospira mesophila TaxID=1293891 RepID=A0A1Y2L0G0_9PROT|nr:hypothetical protein TMES_10490 [Thalassospira mesophila]
MKIAEVPILSSAPENNFKSPNPEATQRRNRPVGHVKRPALHFCKAGRYSKNRVERLNSDRT